MIKWNNKKKFKNKYKWKEEKGLINKQEKLNKIQL